MDRVYSARLLDVLDVDGHRLVDGVRPGHNPDGDAVAALLLEVRRFLECEHAVAGEREINAARRQAHGDGRALWVTGGVAAHLPAGGGVLGEVIDGVGPGNHGRFVHVLDDDVDVQLSTLVVGVGGLDGDLVLVVAAGVLRALVVGGAGEFEDAVSDGEIAPVRAAQAPGDVAVALGVHGGVGGHVAGAVLVVVGDGGNPGDHWRLVNVFDRDGHGDGGVDRRVRVSVNVLAVRNRHGERVTVAGLVIQCGLGAQLAARCNHVEEGGVGTGDRVRAPVVVGICSRDRSANDPSRRCVLVHAAGPGLAGRELRMTVRALGNGNRGAVLSGVVSKRVLQRLVDVLHLHQDGLGGASEWIFVGDGKSVGRRNGRRQRQGHHLAKDRDRGDLAGRVVARVFNP